MSFLIVRRQTDLGDNPVISEPSGISALKLLSQDHRSLVATQGQTFSATAICLLALEGYRAILGQAVEKGMAIHLPPPPIYMAVLLCPPGQQGNRGAPVLLPPGSEHRKPEGMATAGVWR